MADHFTPKDIEENVRQITDSNWKSALRAAMRVLEEPKYLKAERLAAVRRGIEETVQKFGDQHPRQKDKMISWGKFANTADRRFCCRNRIWWNSGRGERLGLRAGRKGDK